MGVGNVGKFIHDCSDDISSMSVLAGGICSVFWIILTARAQKKKNKEDLENEMLEYFRSQNEKGKISEKLIRNKLI